MRRARPMSYLLPLLAVLALAAAPQTAYAGDRIRLEVRLDATNDDPLASGKAKFESRPDRTRFGTEVEDVSTDGDGTVEVMRPSSGVIQSNTITITGGFGDLNLDTRDGDTVTSMQIGDVVHVHDANATLILTGTLVTKD